MKPRRLHSDTIFSISGGSLVWLIREGERARPSGKSQAESLPLIIHRRAASSVYPFPSAMAQYETYQSNAAELPLMRKWLLRALVISLLLHAGLVAFFHVKELE